MLAVRLEDGGRTATASWDVWARPTTWALTAEQYRKAEVSRFVRRVVLGTSFAVLGETGGIPPTVSGRLSTGETFSFVVGRPAFSRYIRMGIVQVAGGGRGPRRRRRRGKGATRGKPRLAGRQDHPALADASVTVCVVSHADHGVKAGQAAPS